MSKALLEQSQSYIFSSSTASGATNVSSDGSTFNVNLSPPIVIGPDVLDCSIGVLQASVWNTSYNIASDYKNQNFTFTTTVAPAGTYSFTIPDGLYSVAGLNSYLSSQFVNLGLPGNLITISGNESTNKSILTFLTSGDSVNFTVVTSVREVLGFNSAVVTAPSANFSYYSNNVAQFDRINEYIIRSNLVVNGIQLNTIPQGLIGSVPVNVAPGSLITYKPPNVVWFSARELIGSSRSNLRFELLDQELRAAPTAGDTWSVTLIIKTITKITL